MTNDEQAVLDVVAEALKPQGFVGATTGPLRANAELAVSMDAKLLVHQEHELAIETLRLLELHERDAVVELSAVDRYRVRAVDGRRGSGQRHFTGPVVLVREDEGWKIVDLLADGRSLRDSVFASDLVGAVEGVEVVLLGGVCLPSQAWFYVEARNRLGRAVKLTGAAGGVVKPDGRWRWGSAEAATSELPTGTFRLELNVNLPESSSTDQLRLLLRTSEGIVDVRPAGASIATRLPLSVRFPQARFLAIAALFVAVGSLFLDRGGVGLGLTVYAAMNLWRLLPQLRYGLNRALANWLAWALVLLAAGGVLLVLGWENRGFEDVRGSYVSWWGLGVVLLIVGGVELLDHLRQHLRQRRKQPGRGLYIALAATVGGLALASVSGGLGPFEHESLAAQRADITGYVEQEIPAKVLSATRVGIVHRRHCTYNVWDVDTTGGRWWAVSSATMLYPHDQFHDIEKLVDHVAEVDREIAGPSGLLGTSASTC